jgi:beta-fructofuranosidase
VWDFWPAREGDTHHLFYLQAPRALGDPELRHWHVSIGHAVSADLASWTVLPDALSPGPPGRWDDYTTWTGSAVRHDGLWHMLYTGTSRAERGLVQRIGLAVSEDLVVWERHGDAPVLEADPRWYELLDLDVWHDQAWRDPWVFRWEGCYHALVTARARDGDPSGRGVIAHATSADFHHWEVLPPVTAPLGFGQMEVPQLVSAGGRSHLLFCGDHGDTGSGTFSLSADLPTGPYEAASLAVLRADRSASSYAGKVIQTAAGPVFLAWDYRGADGAFLGTIGDPLPVAIDERGTLVVGLSADGASGTQAVSW